MIPLTPEELIEIRVYYALIVQALYPSIKDIPIGDDTSIATLTSTWRDAAFARPTNDEIVNTYRNIVKAQVSNRKVEEEKVETRKSTANDVLMQKTGLSITAKDASAVNESLTLIKAELTASPLTFALLSEIMVLLLSMRDLLTDFEPVD